MNNYLAETIREDLRDSIRKFCSWRCVKICAATCACILLPVSFLFQIWAFVTDIWASYYTTEDSGTFGCGVSAEYTDARICGLGATVCSGMLLLVCFGFVVCVRTCKGTFDLQSYTFRRKCSILTLSLLHGILSLVCCSITAGYVSENKKFEYDFAYYVYLYAGCTTTVLSLTSGFGYLCFKFCRAREDFEHKIRQAGIRMKTYLTKTLNIKSGRRLCSWHCVKICVATCIASLVPASFLLQIGAFITDTWASDTILYNNDTTFRDSRSFGCGVSAVNTDARICGLAIVVCSEELLLVCFGFVVCVRSCKGTFDLQTSAVCYVCFIPALSLLHGILSLICCSITVAYVSENKKYGYDFSFYVYLSTGCTTVIVSLASVFGYLCLKLCRVRQDYEYQIGSDDADTETTPILHAVQ